MRPMRLWLLLYFLLLQSLLANEGMADPVYPLWDGQETVAQYAQRVNLPPTETLDLGNGVKLELVLIPAGKFLMGTPEPEAVDEEGFHKKIEVGIALLVVSGAVLLVLLGTIVVQAIRKRRRPQYSLARFLAMAVATGAGLLSGMHAWYSSQALETAKAEYQAAQAHFDATSSDEKPAHSVTLTRPFYLGKFEVTQEQYQQVMGQNPSNFKGQDNPVEQVSWDDAQEFCKRLGAKTQRTIRLPAEAEWEYSCRGGTKTTYYSGDMDKDLERVGWYAANAKNTTHPAGQKEPNAFGLFDIHGNVWEWCQDWFGDVYYSKSSAEDPQGPANGANRVLRGGSWGGNPGFCRSALRVGLNPDDRYSSLGFRVAAPASRTPF